MSFMDNMPNIAIMQLNFDMCDLPTIDEYTQQYEWKIIEKKNGLIRSTHQKDHGQWIETTVAGFLVLKTDVFKKVGQFYQGEKYCKKVWEMGYKSGYLKSVTGRHLGENMYYDYPDHLEKREQYLGLYNGIKPQWEKRN